MNVKAFESVVKVAAFGGRSPIAPLTQWYSIEQIQPTGGLWYFGFRCPVCQRSSPLFQDFSDGNLGQPFKGYGFISSCAFCATKVQCAAEMVISIQWPLTPGQTPPRSEYVHLVERKHTQDDEYRPLQGPLHHYTNLPALQSILSQKKLWATHVRYLNDDSESELGLAIMRQLADEAKLSARSIDSEVLSYFLEWLNKPRPGNESVYVLSFSEARNSLSQWRQYTQYGQGVCLSIQSTVLIERMQAQGWDFQNCRYGQKSQLTWADAILSRFRREAATYCAGPGKENTTHFDSVLQNCLPALYQVAATIKHSAFEAERETRFISPIVAQHDKRVLYRNGRTDGLRIPYVEFDLANHNGELIVEEIMVGPCRKNDQLAVKAWVEKALDNAQITVPCKLVLSDIPYVER